MIYPDRVYNPKFNRQPLIKPLLEQQQRVRPQSVTYSKFGMNLGPKQPVLSMDKYTKQSLIVQSPMMLATKLRGPRDVADTFAVNQKMMTKQIQDTINQRRNLDKQTNTKKSSSKFTKSPSFIRPKNLTFSHMGITNNLQSPSYYHSVAKPSNTAEIGNMYNILQSPRASQTTRKICDRKQKSPFLFGSLRHVKPTAHNITKSQILLNKTNKSIFSQNQLNSPCHQFLQGYQNATSNLLAVQNKVKASKTNAASSLTIATRDDTQHELLIQGRRSCSSVQSTRNLSTQSHQQMGMKRSQPEFFKTDTQHMFDQLTIGNKINPQKAKEFSFTRYKKRANTNYDMIPSGSRHKAINFHQPDFQMRITFDNGEPNLPQNPTTIYKPVADYKRFSSNLEPQQDAYRENICHAFVSVKNNRILQKSAAKAREVYTGRKDKQAILGQKRKHGFGMFKMPVAAKPRHAIDSF